ncbi:MgtC/SapB family protein [Patescibacteria group bacterium]|nr:MgtC/SapB family protein [Patescibacteria group bacterium]
MKFFVSPQIRIIFQLILAALLGGLVGLEREYKKKEAGLRTYALVSLGAALFTIISFEALNLFAGKPGINFDPSRVIGQVVLGVGFLGAGLIIYRQLHIEGLTTAAGLWITAAIGVAVGTRLYFPAIFATFLTILILAGLRIVEKKIFNSRDSE